MSPKEEETEDLGVVDLSFKRKPDEELLRPTQWLEQAAVMVVGSFVLTVDWDSRTATEPATGILNVRVLDTMGVRGSAAFQWSGSMEEAKWAAIFHLQHNRVPGPEDPIPAFG